MRGLQTVERPPVLPLGFTARHVQYASAPAQPLADSVRPTACAVVGLFALGLVGQFVAMPARIHLAPIQHRHTPPTTHSRAKPPGALPAIVASRLGQAHRVIHILPLIAVIPGAIVQDLAVGFGADFDGCHFIAPHVSSAN